MERRNHQLVKRHKDLIMLSLWTPPVRRAVPPGIAPPVWVAPPTTALPPTARTARKATPLPPSQEQLELSMMRNQLIHLFVPEGFVALCMYAAEKGSAPPPASPFRTPGPQAEAHLFFKG